MNHQPPDWAYETPPTAFCPPPRAGSVAVAAGRAAVDGDEHGVLSPAPSTPDVTPSRLSPAEFAATPVAATASPAGESEPRERRPARVRTFVKLSVLYLAVAAAVVVLFPPATTAADMTQRERSELFASGEMPGGVYQVGDGPFVVAGEASESSLQGGPVLLTVPGSVGTAPAVIFGRASDLSAEVTAKKGAEFTMVRSGGVEIPFVVDDVLSLEKGAPLPIEMQDDSLLVTYCDGDCTGLVGVVASPKTLPDEIASVQSSPGSAFVLPSPPAASGGVFVSAGVVALVGAAALFAAFATVRWWPGVSVPVGLAVVLVVAHLAAGFAGSTGSWGV